MKATKTSQRSIDADCKILKAVDSVNNVGAIFSHVGQWKRAEDLADKKLLARKQGPQVPRGELEAGMIVYYDPDMNQGRLLKALDNLPHVRIRRGRVRFIPATGMCKWQRDRLVVNVKVVMKSTYSWKKETPP